MAVKLINVTDMADMLGISRTHAYELVNAKVIPTVNVAKPNSKTRRLKVNMEDLEKFIKEGGVKDGAY
jgi:hypothetical protein